MSSKDLLFADIPPEVERATELLIQVADKIHEILKKKGLSQKELAELLEISEARVSYILSGSANLTFETIAKIEVAIGENIIDTVRTTDPWSSWLSKHIESKAEAESPESA